RMIHNSNKTFNKMGVFRDMTRFHFLRDEKMSSLMHTTSLRKGILPVWFSFLFLLFLIPLNSCQNYSRKRTCSDIPGCANIAPGDLIRTDALQQAEAEYIFEKPGLTKSATIHNNTICTRGLVG
ncbi:MAG: hypothetical protein DSY80_08035, partial [Desulfocapsa sp.]